MPLVGDDDGGAGVDVAHPSDNSAILRPAVEILPASRYLPWIFHLLRSKLIETKTKITSSYFSFAKLMNILHKIYVSLK